MTVGVRAFQGERLRQARLARGLSKSALADKIGVTGAAVGRYEDGNDSPRQERMQALCSVLGFSEAFFLKPIWLDHRGPIFWRDYASESKFAREMTVQRTSWLSEIFAFLEEEVEFPDLDLPELKIPEDFRLLSTADIEGIAMAVRRHWNLRDNPVPDIALALENAGIPVSAFEIPSEKQDGFCFWSKRLTRAFVGVNTRDISFARMRFDLAHELGHVVLHKGATEEQAKDPVTHKIIEKQANRFAGAFLFPMDAFISEATIPTLDYFSSLKRRWGISISAMIYRAHDIGLIDEYQRASLYKNMARRQWRGPRREPYDDLPLERPRMLKRAMKVLAEDLGYLSSTILSILALPAPEVEQIVGMDTGQLSSTGQQSLAKVKSFAPLKAVDIETGKVIEFPMGRAINRS